jgi:hypothetical protein
MDRVYLFLIRNDVWIYIVSMLGVFWYLTELIRAQHTLRRAMFNLEKETATSARNHALSFLLFFAFVIGSVYYVNRNIAPNLPAELMVPPTPTVDIFATPLAPPTPITTAEAGESIFEPILAPTATLPGEPGLGSTDVISGTQEVGPAADASPTPFTTCIPELNFTEPLNGSVAFQTVIFRGTANTGELHQYIIELQGPETLGGWAPASQERLNQPVINGDLGQADLSLYEPGPYLVRMTAFDAAGQALGYCQIQITLDN